MNDPVAPSALEDALRALLRADAPPGAPSHLLARLLAIPDSATASPGARFRQRAMRIGGAAGAVAALSLAVLLLAVLRVGPFAGVGAGSVPGNPVAWSTPYAALTADDFAIDAGGRRFTAANAQVAIHSDPGDATYRTLELSWTEQGVEMRLFLYFAADAREWWVTEIRTYDGLPNTRGSNWIYYDGPFFRTPLGQTYRGDVDLKSTRSDNGARGHLTISGLRLQAFSAGASDAPRPIQTATPVGSPVPCPSGARCVSVDTVLQPVGGPILASPEPGTSTP